MLASSSVIPSRREHTRTVLVPVARCHHDCVSRTLSMSCSASSATVRFLRFTTRRKSVKAYSVPGTDRETGKAGAEDHKICSQGNGNVATLFIDTSNLRHQQEP